MWYIAAVAGVVVVSTLAGIVRTKGLSTADDNPVSSIINSAQIKSLSMDQINFLLARLETEEAPAPVFGAMCYEMMAAPLVAEYVCPVCGEKTLYENTHTAFIEWEIDGARRLAESINQSTDFTIELDETLFCDFCSDDADAGPGLLLRVIHEDGEEFVNRVSLTDLRKLSSFLHGRLYWLTDNDSQEPLQNDVDRIREMLGI